MFTWLSFGSALPSKVAQFSVGANRAMPEWMETAAEPEHFPNLMEGAAVTDVSLSIVCDAMLPSLSQLLAKKLGANGATLH